MLPELHPERMAPVWRVAHLYTTRICWMGCPFCDIAHMESKPQSGLSPDRLDHDGGPWDGVDLVKLHGGLSIEEPFDYWLQLIRDVKRRSSKPLWAFSPQELYHFHQKEHRSFRDLLAGLKWAGVEGLGPGGSESLHTPWSAHRMTARDWATVARGARDLALSLTAALIVPPLSDPAIVDAFVQNLAAIPVTAIDVKPLRAAHTPLGHLGDTEMLEVVPVIQRLRELTDLPIYVRLDSRRPDAQLWLSSAGVDRFFVPAWSVSP